MRVRSRFPSLATSIYIFVKSAICRVRAQFRFRFQIIVFFSPNFIWKKAIRRQRILVRFLNFDREQRKVEMNFE